jgi:hypothetical protein
MLGKKGSGMDTIHKGEYHFVGVYWNRRDKRWVVSIRINGKMKNFGSFASELEGGLHWAAYKWATAGPSTRTMSKWCALTDEARLEALYEHQIGNRTGSMHKR